MKNKILLFIPMYNCEKQISRVLSQVDEKVASLISQVIVVNNRSTDGSEKAVVDFCETAKAQGKLMAPVTLLRNKDNYSLGGSHKVAFQFAMDYGFDYVIVLHGDDQGDVHDLVPYLENNSIEKYDSFLGSRFEKTSKLINYSGFRIFGNHVFNFFISFMVGRRLTDLGSGLNLYKTQYLKNKFFMNFPNNLTYNVYMLLYGVFSKSEFTFFPLSWREEDQISNAKMFKQSKEILQLTLQYIINKKKLFSGEDNNFSAIDYQSETVYDSAR